MVGTLGVAGAGLIGGSIGLAAKERHLAGKVIGIGRSEARLQVAQRLGAIDEYTTDFLDGARSCDLLYLATPITTIIHQITLLRDLRGKDLVVTDGGSTKREIVEASKGLPANIRFVGGHPMAGSEQAGVEAARGNLYEGATYVITPDGATEAGAADLVERFAKALGANVLVMEPGLHDRLVARTSHLPHIIARAYLQAISASASEASALTAGSFRDLTRVASSSPTLWTDICMTNRTEILAALREMRLALDQAEQVLSLGQSSELEGWLEEGREIRARFINRKEIGE